MNNNIRKSTALDYKRRICAAMNFISHNLDREISLEEIAKEATFSSYHFHRIFKAVVGETVASFIKRLRLEMAANNLLANSQKDITTIAIDCGFSSSQNFAKAFRSYYKMSPSEYRISKNGNKDSKEENALSLNVVYYPEQIMLNKNERIMEMKCEIKDMPDFNVAYVRKIGPYGKETCEQAFSELMQWAAPKGFLKEKTVLGVYWDNPEVTPPEKCRTDACVCVPADTPTEGQIAMQTISGGNYLVCNFEITENNFQQAWEDAFAYFVQQGYDCRDKPCYELYHNNGLEHPEGKWIFDICIPVK